MNLSYHCDNSTKNLGDCVLYMGEFDALVKVENWPEFFKKPTAPAWGISTNVVYAVKNGFDFNILYVYDESSLKYKVSTSCHDMHCIQMVGASVTDLQKIRSFVNRVQWLDDPMSSIINKSGVFIQGYDEPEGWILLEFWKPTYLPFVFALNSHMSERT